MSSSVSTSRVDVAGYRIPRPASDVSHDGLAGLLLATGLFAFYMSVQSVDFLGWDGRTMANVTQNILDHRKQLVTPDVSWWVNDFPGDKSPFGIGMSLISSTARGNTARRRS